MCKSVTTFDLSLLNETQLGKAMLGVVSGNTVQLAWKTYSSEVESLHLAIFRIGQQPEYIALNPCNTRGTIAEETVPFNTTGIVQCMLLVARIGGSSFRLAHHEKNFNLHRLLSLSIPEVNANLRRHGRIKDLDTRFFSACNSMKANPEKFTMNARCVASFSYTAMEKDRQEMVEWAYDFCISKIDQIVSTPNIDVKVSMITLWLHLAIWKGSGQDLFRISEILIDSFDGISEYPIATYNSLALMVMIGGFLLFTENKDKAGEIFAPFDAHLKIAATGYIQPRYLMTYREFIRIAECAYLCSLGLSMSKGESYHAALPLLSPEMAWNKANRFYRGDDTKPCPAQDEGLQRYLRLIKDCQKGTL